MTAPDSGDRAPAVGPALTAEEWALGIPQATRGHLDIVRWDEVGREMFITTKANGGCQIHIAGRDMHALAALALYQQPFGFTREDVAAALHGAHWAGYGGDPDHIERLRSLAARIAALLPPE